MTESSNPEIDGAWVALGHRAWHVQTIWAAARDLPVQSIPVTEITELDQDCWFEGIGVAPTVRAVASHAKAILAANPDEPIVLAADGQVLDGMHRVARALIEGRHDVRAVRLTVDPAPDWLLKQ